jgi:hypothetical protein
MLDCELYLYMSSFIELLVIFKIALIKLGSGSLVYSVDYFKFYDSIFKSLRRFLTMVVFYIK